MDLEFKKKRLRETEARLVDEPLAHFETLETPHGVLRVVVSARLRRKCKKGRVWMSVPMLTALKNAVYGFDPIGSRRRGGFDGIFVVDRGFKPANAMIKKLYDKFLDKPDELVAIVAKRLGVRSDTLQPVRLVSHHMRLLGVLADASPLTLVLVDFDNDKH